MFMILKHALSWVVDALPEISNLILVFVGVFLSFPSLAQKIEDRAIARYSIGLGCLVFGLCGFIVSVNQRRQATLEIYSISGNVNVLVASTNDLVNKTNNAVTALSIMLPQIAHIADLDDKLSASKGNTRSTADLQAQKTTAQNQLATASRTLVLQLVPVVASELQILTDKCLQGEISLENMKALHLTGNPETNRQVEEEYTRQKSEFVARCDAQTIPIMVNANYLREELLRGQELTQEDKDFAVTFAKSLAGQPIPYTNARLVAIYLNALAKRFSPNPPVNVDLPSGSAHVIRRYLNR